MCDYSLQSIASRPAKVGETLISTCFPNAITRGFGSPADPSIAVCLLPGTEVAFERPVEYDGWLPFLPTRRVTQLVACFREINLKYPAAHHDALEFPDGRMVLVNSLKEGQRMTVLQLSALARLELELEAHSIAPVHTDHEDIADRMREMVR